MIRSIILLIVTGISLAAQEPLRQATEARLWLRVPESQAPLPDIQVSGGTATPAPWEKDPAARNRLIDVIFPVCWWEWCEITISFTPAEDGEVSLILNGPWEEEKPGVVFRKEILWDDLSADGTLIINGDFESQKDGVPENWEPAYQNYPPPDSWPLKNSKPLHGKSLAASCQSRPLAQTLKLKAGRKLTLRLHAKAATLPDFVEPKILGHDTPAHAALAKIKRGVNLSNCWEAPPPYSWGIRYTVDDIDRIAEQGFDHIRVPVAWHHHLKHTGDHDEIDPALFSDLEPILRRALDKKLHVLLDWHHFDDLTNNPSANRSRFVSTWESIARHFKNWPDGLFLELLNEPQAALTTEVANSLYSDTIAAIRRIDPRRILIVSPGKWGDARELDNLRLPDKDDRIGVTVHCYEPFHFTHQGASWVNLQDLKGIRYPGPPTTPLPLPDSLKDNAGIRSFIEGYNTLPADRNPSSAIAVRQLLALAHSWSDHFGRPVHLGEFGSTRIADTASRARHAHDVRTLAEERGIPWTLWDWKSGFGYWDSGTNKPLFRSALFD